MIMGDALKETNKLDLKTMNLPDGTNNVNEIPQKNIKQKPCHRPTYMVIIKR